MSRSGAMGAGIGRAGRRVLYGTGGIRRVVERVRPRACVLMYHRIAAPASDPFGQAVDPNRFRQHLEAVKETYHVIAVDELLAHLHDGDYPDGAVAVTFDDGYADTLSTAYPAAASCDVPIHVFVTAGPVAAEERIFWWDELATLSAAGGYGALHDELRRLPDDVRQARLTALRNGSAARGDVHAGRPLRPDEVRKLAQLPFARVGSHTLTHSALGALTPEEQLVELVEARRRLERMTGAEIDVLAYPFGKETDVSDETGRLAAEAGYRAAFLSTPRALVPTSDRFGLPRLAVHDWAPDHLLTRIRDVLGPVRSLRPGRDRTGEVVYHGGRKRRSVALTFDDGPSQWTPMILDILRDHAAHATFFVLGSAVSGREDILRRMVAEGNEVGNHLYEHHDPFSLTDEDLRAQLERGGQAIARVAERMPQLVRPPYGHDARRVSRIAAATGLGPTVLGSVDPSDWGASAAAPIVRHVLRAVRPGAIVFLHDGVPPPDGTAATSDRAPTVEAVGQLVPELAARGYELVTVSELLR